LGHWSKGAVQVIRRLLGFAAVSASLVLIPASAGASVTVGQLAPGSSPTGFSDPGGHWDLTQPTVTSGNTFVVPGNGTITSWSHNAAAGTGQMLAFKVFRPVTGSTYMAVGHDGPRLLTGGAVNTFQCNIPVKSGDLIGLSFDLAPPAKATFFVVNGDSSSFRNGNLADGQTGSFSSDGSGLNRRVNASAIFVPTNTFTRGTISRNKKKGTATLTFAVPNSGELTGTGKGAKISSSGGAVTSKVVSPGQAKLKISAKGKNRAMLNATGKVKLKLKVTYIPTGGDPSTQSLKVKLIKR
jgi:hypothetical protein